MKSAVNVRGVLLLAVPLCFAASRAAAAEGPLQFYSVTPCRLADTRDAQGPTGGPALAHNAVRSFPVYGLTARDCGIPPTARAVALNVACISPTNDGHITVFGYNLAFPSTSTLNFSGTLFALANGALIPLPPDPGAQLPYHVSVYSTFSLGAGHTVHLVLDVTGYFQ
jgi:hypothetical protein